MSLVPYGDSDDSDSESDEENVFTPSAPSSSSSSSSRLPPPATVALPPSMRSRLSPPATVALPPSISSSSSSSSKRSAPEVSSSSSKRSKQSSKSSSSSLFASLPKPKSESTKKEKKRKKKHKDKKDRKKKKKKSKSEQSESDVAALSNGASSSSKAAPSQKPLVVPDPTSLLTMLPAPKVGPDIPDRLKPKVSLAPKVAPLSREEKRKQQELRLQKQRDKNFNRKVVPRSALLGSFAIKTDEELEAEEAAAAEAEEVRLAEEEAQRLKYTAQPSITALLGSFAIKTDEEREAEEAAAAEAEEARLAEEEAQQLKYTAQPSITYSQLKAQDDVLSKLKPDDPQFAQALEKNPLMFEVRANDLTAGSWTPADRFKNVDAKDSGENKVKAQFWDARQGTTIQTNEPSKLHSRKHQINSLAFKHQELAHQFKEHRAKGFSKRQQSMSKYGF